VENLPFQIIDYMDSDEPVVAKKEPEPLPISFGRNLGTVERAREWLSNPHNWFESELFILRWDGIVPYISRRAAQGMIERTWDDGLPWVAVWKQNELRSGKKEDIEKPEGPTGVEETPPED
jgi:hypothetical protein